jgi:hypothetical protein
MRGRCGGGEEREVWWMGGEGGVVGGRRGRCGGGGAAVDGEGREVQGKVGGRGVVDVEGREVWGERRAVVVEGRGEERCGGGRARWGIEERATLHGMFLRCVCVRGLW